MDKQKLPLNTLSSLQKKFQNVSVNREYWNYFQTDTSWGDFNSISYMISFQTGVFLKIYIWDKVYTCLLSYTSDVKFVCLQNMMKVGKY